jgi:hypothetical protein
MDVMLLGGTGLSLHHLTGKDRITNIRSVHIDASTHDQVLASSGSAPCLAVSGTDGTLVSFDCIARYLAYPPSYPLPSVRVCSPHFSITLHPPVGTRVGRLVSRRCHIIGSLAQVSSDLRYYEGSDPCRVIPQSRSPRLLRLTFLTFHPQPRDVPVHRFTRHFSVYGEFQASPYPSRLAADIPPNQVRHPTDRQFASGCSPPRLTATQLPSATEPWHAPTPTSTVLIRRPHGRTRGVRPCARAFPHRRDPS